MKSSRKRPIVHYSTHRLNQLEQASGYRFPGKIVAAAEWTGKTEKQKDPLGTDIPQGSKEKITADNISQTPKKSKWD